MYSTLCLLYKHYPIECREHFTDEELRPGKVNTMPKVTQLGVGGGRVKVEPTLVLTLCTRP